MSKGIRPEDLGAAIEQELTIYADEVQEGVEEAAERAAKKLVKLTRATAPKGSRGSFRKNITRTRRQLGPRRVEQVWHVKAPDARLTHLVVHGHATKDGGRTKGNPFLQDALDQVLPEYEREVKEAITK
jgi:hypothetical protein